MPGETVCYLRVSTIDQNLARQEDLKAECSRVFEEKASAGTADRPELQRMLDFVRDGDKVIVHSIDRLARSLKDLFEIIDKLKEKNVSIEFRKENIIFDPTAEADPFMTLQFTLIGAFAQFEREISKQRQKEGIAKARQVPGKYKGRKRKLTDEQVKAALRQHHEYKTPKAELARELRVSRTTLNKEFAAFAKKSE